jgi:serine/tyrosine/threonine adenylyltransferase
VLRSSIREFLCSEAMHHLGVPTTRALSLVAHRRDLVVRDMLYDGNARPEPGAVVCRVAPSFTRFGTSNCRPPGATRTAASSSSTRSAPTSPTSSTPTAEFADQVARTVRRGVPHRRPGSSHWMRVGFVHGVLNTDNMSILGLTIDYGPYGWLEDFDPGWTPNTTDAGTRRYRYGMQPQVVQWNLVQLANALVAC